MTDDTYTPAETGSNQGDLTYISESLRGLAVPIDSLMPDPANARLHSPRNLDVIKGSLLRFGQLKAIVVDERGLVLAGNGSLAAARSLGWTHIAAVRSSLTGAEAAAFGVVDNRSAELAQWDDDALARTLQGLTADNMDLLIVGFTPDEVAKLINSQTGAGDLPADAGGTEYDESIADDVARCPHCNLPL